MRPPEDQSQGVRHDRTENTGNRSQLPVTPWFASRRRWRSARSLRKTLIFQYPRLPRVPRITGVSKDYWCQFFFRRKKNCSENPASNWPGGAISAPDPHEVPGVHCFRGGGRASVVQDPVRWHRHRRAVCRHANWSREMSVGGRREGDILLPVLPKVRGQQYWVRCDVRARLTRGLDAPMIIGL